MRALLHRIGGARRPLALALLGAVVSAVGLWIVVQGSVLPLALGGIVSAAWIGAPRLRAASRVVAA